MKNKQRFQVTPVSDTYGSFRGDSQQLGVPNLDIRRSSHTVQAIPSENERRRLSLAQWTREALPRLDHFRVSKRALKRPSLGELYGDPERKASAIEDDSPAAGGGGHIKLGWIVGVVIPCLLNIWGVMLFLRLSWVVGQAGIYQTLIIIGISAMVCVVTTLSLSAICTNGEVKGGGIYYIISRSLGPEFGASLGVVFAFANAVAASMNTIGFCDSLNDLLKTHGLKIIDNGVMDTRIVGSVALLVMVIICAVGMDWEAQAQNFLVVTIMLAILDFIIGTLLGPSSDQEIAEGFVGFSLENFKANWGPDYRYAENVNQNFFTVFSIYFPSVTGIQAGANICGDLKDAASAIPKGTNIAVAVSMFSYAVFAVFAGGGALRDASGNMSDFINGTHIPTCAHDHSCQYGLQNSYSVMQLMSVWGGLIYAGCFAATLSTALTNLLSVPRLIQALGIDQIYPGLIFFSKGYGKHGEPYRGYVLTFIISLTFLLIANLNAIAPLISTFYLASYALINFCTFHAALVKPLGWRPTFRYYNKWLSLFGCLLCAAIMFLMNWLSSLITLAIILALYLVVVYRKPDVNWGSSTQQQIYKSALTSAQKLQNVSDHVKNYHPQVLVLAGRPLDRPPLIDLAHLITKHHSLLMVGQVTTKNLSYRTRVSLTKEAQQWFEARKIKAFYNLIDGISFEEGVHALIQASGFGKLSPNIILMGYKADWQTCADNELLAYFNVLDNAFDNRMSVAILRIQNGLDYSDLNTQINQMGVDNPTFQMSNSTHSLNTNGDPLSAIKPKPLMHADSNLNIDLTGSHTSINIIVPQKSEYTSKNQAQRPVNKNLGDNPIVYSTRGGSAVPKEILDNLNVFNRKQGKGTIDVWWLYDDGGLTILIPYIISTRSYWSQCKIRVFALTNRKLELEIEERNMANLLSKLRIDYSSLTMLQGVTDKPKSSTIQMHNALINGFREGQRESGYIPDTELKTLEEKTNRQLRLREMLLEHSSPANLVIMSLPMPRRGSVSAPLYMSWLEVLTKDMPPLILVRGNHQNVLTFYS